MTSVEVRELRREGRRACSLSSDCAFQSNPMKFASQGAEPQEFAEICRLATAKHLPGPDEYLTAQAVHQVNTGQINSQAATEALCKRLRQVCAQGRREQKVRGTCLGTLSCCCRCNLQGLRASLEHVAILSMSTASCFLPFVHNPSAFDNLIQMSNVCRLCLP